MQTEAVMTRYRELGSNLEASIQVQTELQERGGVHWHRLYERCWCGHLTIPAKYYEYKDGVQTNTREQAERTYLASLQAVPTTDVPTCECRKPREGRYSSCSACRKRAYRERRSS